MSTPFWNPTDPCKSPPAPSAPERFTVPARAWNAHAHVIGTPPRFELDPNRPYTSTGASPEAYVAMLDATGFEYGLLLQVTSHGFDNSLMLEAITASPHRLKGVALVPRTISDAQKDQLKQGGVIGVRFLAGSGRALDLEYLHALLGMSAELGWQIHMGIEPEHLAELRPIIERYDVPIVADHMCGLMPRHLQSPEMDEAVGLARNSNFWMKLSLGHQVIAYGHDIKATTDIARMFVDQIPTRLVWGSNWPFPGVYDPHPIPSPKDVADLICDWVEDPQIRDEILTGNPTRLFGRPSSTGPDSGARYTYA